MKKLTILFVAVLLMQSFGYAADSNKSVSIRPALLIIDIQNRYLPWMDESERDMALQYINGGIQLFRQRHLPIIRIYHTDPDYGPHPDSLAFRFPESVLIRNSDPMIIKNHPSAFKNTGLDSLLKSMECNTLFLSGLSSVGCVLATYFGALDHDYKAFMFKNAIMSHNAAYTGYVEEITDTVPWTAIELMLDSAKK